jgi:DNA polymerase III subunit delta
MAEKKAHEVEGWLKRPDPGAGIVLLYGPDRGLVSERALAYAGSTGLALDDPFAVIRIDASDIERDPERLQVEVGTVPMFGGERLVWIRNGGAGSALAAEVKALCDNPPHGVRVLVEAGELRKGTPMRSAVERARNAMALPCYADEGRTIDTLIDETLRGFGLGIDQDARYALRANLGGDRLATRGELEKLALYCSGQDRVTIDDVRMATGNASSTSLDSVVDAVLLGDRTSADLAFATLAATGGIQGIPLALQRQFQQLELLRDTMERGNSASSAVASAKPPVFFSRRKTVEAALQRWQGAATAQANHLISQAIFRVRQNSRAADAEAHRLVLQLIALPRNAGN